MSPTIRKAELSDANVVTKLLAELKNYEMALLDSAMQKIQENRTETTRTLKDVKAILRSKSKVVYLSEIDGKPVGLILGEFDGKNKEVYFDIYVKASRRREGVGSSLIRHLEKSVDRKKYKAISLTVYVKNAKAKKFYKKQGYVPLLEIHKKAL